ncbi:MAG: CaiB/BaiF CoA transferase family protein, partial [Janthinobacterium lividum]
MKPLSGLRIVEFDGIGPIPFCSMLLSDLGAEVVRLTRGGGGAWADVGGSVMHRGRAGVTIDLKNPAAREQVLSLLEGADGLVEGFRPGVMERLGLGPDDCHARNPRLVYGRMTGYGQHGPMANAAGHDINYISLSGALHASGDPRSPPVPALNLVGDYGGGAMFLAVGMLSGLLEVARTGVGRVVDAAMTDGSALLMSLFYAFRSSGQWEDRRGSNLLDGSAPFYRCYACADGRYVAVGALEPAFFALLLKGLEIPAGDIVQSDKATWPAMTERFAAAFATRTRDEWDTVFGGTDACVTPVLSLDEAPHHPHNRARGSFAASAGVMQPAPAPRFLPEDGCDTIPGPATSTDMEAVTARWKA